MGVVGRTVVGDDGVGRGGGGAGVADRLGLGAAGGRAEQAGLDRFVGLQGLTGLGILHQLEELAVHVGQQCLLLVRRLLGVGSLLVEVVLQRLGLRLGFGQPGQLGVGALHGPP